MTLILGDVVLRQHLRKSLARAHALGPMALVLGLGLPLRASDPPQAAAAVPAAPGPGQPDPGLERKGYDPGPPRKDPEERIEADPAWTWPEATHRGRMTGTWVDLPGLASRPIERLITASLLHDERLPFFQSLPGERAGSVRYLSLEGVGAKDVRHLVWGKHDFLFWVNGDAPHLNLLAPTGLCSKLQLAENKRIHALGRDGGGGLAFLGDHGYGVLHNGFPAPGGRPTGRGFDLEAHLTPAGVRQAFWIRDHFRVVNGTGMSRQGPDQETPSRALLHQDRPWSGATAMAMSREAKAMVAIRPDRDEITLLVQGQAPVEHALAAGSRPQAAAAGPGAQIWVALGGTTAEGHSQYLVFDPGDGSLQARGIAKGAEGPKGFRAIAQGPDGCMWLAREGTVVRLDPEGNAELVALLPGDLPQELVPTDQGLLFTLEGSSRIGFIRALPVVGADGRPEPAPPMAEPRAARVKRMTRAEKQAMLDLQVRKGIERETARQAEAAEAARAEAVAGSPAREGAGDSKAATGERKRPLPGAAKPASGSAAPAPEETKALPAKPGAGDAGGPGDPLAALADMGVDLAEADLAYILSTHGWGRKAGKSQFAKAHSSPAAMAALIARGLAESGAIGCITDTRRRVSYTKCRVPGVGLNDHWGDPEPTDHFIVITRPFFSEPLQAWVHGVVNAYPVDRRW